MVGFQQVCVIFLHYFNATADAEPTVSFAVPLGVTQLTPFEHCNLHQSWQGTVHGAWAPSPIPKP